MRLDRKALSALGLASVMVSIAGVGAARADFFDAIGRIFGGDPSPAPAMERYYEPPPLRYQGDDSAGPLGMTVRPRAATRKRETIRRPEKPAVAQATLDPAKNPNWHLDDPTLRRGDIVVLKGEVLVFQGGGGLPHGREDFASLDQARLSPSEKAQLRQMAGIPAPSRTAQAPRSQVASVDVSSN